VQNRFGPGATRLFWRSTAPRNKSDYEMQLPVSKNLKSTSTVNQKDLSRDAKSGSALNARPLDVN